MTQEDRNRADARFNKAARAANEAKTGRSERDAALKAVTDNMAKLKALRLAREAAAASRPPPTVKKARAKSKKPDEKGSGFGRLAGRPAKRRTPDLNTPSPG